MTTTRSTTPGRPLLAALAVVFLSAPATALDPGLELHQYARDRWGEDDGLPQNSVPAIIQARDGYLWLATQEGLVRFDGVRFTVFDRGNTPALRANHVERIVEAPDGTLWLGTYGGGLLSVRDGQFRGRSRSSTPESDAIRGLAVAANGDLWVGTDSGLGLHAADNGLRHFTRADGLPANEVRSLTIDSRGTLWVGTVAGLARRSGERFLTLPLDGLPHPAVNALAFDAKGALWVGTAEGLARLPAGGSGFETPAGAPTDPVRTLYVDRAGSLWIGTTAALARLSLSDGDVPGQALDIAGVTALLEDREGSLWIGTDGAGLHRLKEGRAVTYSGADGLGDEVVYSLTGDVGGAFWVGTASGELYRFRPDDHRRHFTPLQATALRGHTVRALLRGADGTLWIGTEVGLHRVEDGTVRLHPASARLPTYPVRALAEDAQGALWIGTDGGGLARLAGDEIRVYTAGDGLAGDQVRAILPTPEGLWVGTYGGLSRLADGSIASYTAADGLSSPLVRSLHLDADGTLWIGSYGGGLTRYRDGRFTAVTSREGLFDDVLYQILDDGAGRLWFSCNRGVFSVRKAEIEALAVGRVRRIRSESYGRSDGMLSRECNGGSPAAWRDGKGGLWFATVRGVVLIDPSAQRQNLLPPPVVIEQVQADGALLPVAETAVLSPGTRSLEFAYTALSLVAGRRNRFAYRLDGFDAEWTDAGERRQAYYTNLPPGQYRFRVRAANNDGVWNETGAAFAFRLRPFFYQTAAFYGLAVLLAAGAGIGLHRVRVRALRRRERQLRQRVEEALGEIKVLGGLLPICSSCKKIRDDGGYWNQLETFIRAHSHAQFTHSICPECMARLYPEFASRSTEV